MRYGAVIALLFLVACGGARTGPPTFVPATTDAARPGSTQLSWQLSTRYAAIGASDAVGIGASVPCGLYTSTFAGCPGGTGYVPVLSRDDEPTLLASTYLDDLGLSGAVIGSDIRTMVNRYGSASYDACRPRIFVDTVPGDFITYETPKIPAGTDQVTLFAGGNDAMGLVNALGCGAGGTTAASQAAFIHQWTAAFANDLTTLVKAVRSKAPTARIGIANLPDLADIPMSWSRTAAQKAALTQFAVGFDLAINALHSPAANIVVVDLLCDSQSYITANYASDGFHPNDAGYANLASHLYAQLRAIGNKTSPPISPAPVTCPRVAATAQIRATQSAVRMGDLLPNPEMAR